MRWKKKSELSSNPKPGDKCLFLRKPFGLLPHFLDCGCIVWRRSYLQSWKYGQTILEEVLAGIQVRPHQWHSKTNCLECMQEMIDNTDSDVTTVEEMLIHEEKSGVCVCRT